MLQSNKFQTKLFENRNKLIDVLDDMKIQVHFKCQVIENFQKLESLTPEQCELAEQLFIDVERLVEEYNRGNRFMLTLNNLVLGKALKGFKYVDIPDVGEEEVIWPAL